MSLKSRVRRFLGIDDQKNGRIRVRSYPSWALGAAAVIAACGRPAHAPLLEVAELPVTRVVLYQSGVGYFERAGKIDDTVLSLQIHPSQINDLLKSLTVVDAGTGRAVSVSLPLEQNADRILNELPEQVRNAGGVLEVLRVFRGAHVAIEGQLGEVEGRVVGIENLETTGSSEVSADWRVSLKTVDDELVIYPVSAIKKIALFDKTLSVGLERSLDVSLGEGGWKPIQVLVRLAGNQAHRLKVSYIVEMPRWKPAYRLVLAPGEKPLLQGWAVVDNVSGETWERVQLSLVSGAPISFRYDLHSPQYTERVDLSPRTHTQAAAPPPPEAAGYGADEVAVSEEAEYKKEVAEGDYDPSAPAGAPAPAPPSARLASKSSTRQDDASTPQEALRTLEAQGSEARQEKLGALFRYDLPDPVTVPDRSSTLVNIVNQRISGEEVVYFRPELQSNLSETHPYRAVKFDNATGFTLESGPITVYSEGTFVGEGFVERMESGKTAFLTFAVDGNVLLDSHGGTRDEGMRLLSIVDGVIVVESQRIESTTYEVKNRHRQPTRAYIRSLKRSGWSLVERPRDTVETPEAWIVPLDVGAQSSAKIDVQLAQRLERRLALQSDNTLDVFRLYLAGGKAPAPIKQALEGVIALKSQIGDKHKDEQRLRTQHEQLSRDQDRVRANINVLRKTPGNDALQAELSRKLAALEADLGKLSGRLVKLSEEIAELEARMKVLIQGISLKAE